jgi:hypothetical protein
MENQMRIFGSAILAASLLVTNAFAAETLSAGKPAGVKKAQEDNRNTIMIISGIGLAGLGIGLAASSNGGGPTTSTSPTTTTTTTTNP